MRIFVQNILIFVTETLKMTQRAKLIIRLFFILASAAFANVYGQNINL